MEPLPVVLLLVGVNSLGTGFGWAGIYFIASQAFGFGDTDNLILAVLMGTVYTLLAAAAGRIIGWLNRISGVGRRGVLLTILLGAGATCLLPAIVDHVLTVWIFGLLYPAQMGLLWPVVESYLSSGRRGGSLRRAVALFNLTWASATLIALWGIAPVLEAYPLWSFIGLGACHIFTGPLVLLLSKEPSSTAGSASHVHSPEEARRYRRLLVRFRVLLLVSYALLAALSPLLPGILDRLSIALVWQTPLTSLWMGTRLAMFGLMGAWHGWHGRRRTLLWSTLVLVSGFGLTLLQVSTIGVIVGLILLGAGAGAIYAAALYYALEAEAAQVEAGGKHEALIGSGYAIGPVLGLACHHLLLAFR